MIRITHPRPVLGRQKALGIEFRDGVAEVTELHPERDRALRQHGFEVAEIIEGIPLESLTRAELLDIAAIEGIDLPSKATKGQIIAAIDAHSGIPVVE